MERELKLFFAAIKSHNKELISQVLPQGAEIEEAVYVFDFEENPRVKIDDDTPTRHLIEIFNNDISKIEDECIVDGFKFSLAHFRWTYLYKISLYKFRDDTIMNVLPSQENKMLLMNYMDENGYEYNSIHVVQNELRIEHAKMVKWFQGLRDA